MTETETKKIGKQAKAGRPETKNKNQDRPLNRTKIQELLDDLGILEYWPKEENRHNKPEITIKVYSNKLKPRMFQALELVYEPEDIILEIADLDSEDYYYWIHIKNPILNLSKYMNMDYEPEGSHE